MTPSQIKDLRLKKGWTQAQLAERLECSVATIKDWESGRRNPNKQAKKILKMLAQ